MNARRRSTSPAQMYHAVAVTAAVVAMWLLMVAVQL